MDRKFRQEKDLIGTIDFPQNCLHGIATERALRCSSIGAQHMPQDFIHTIGLIKYACAKANVDLGLLPQNKGNAIAQAAWEVYEGKHDDTFRVEIFQTGGCTPTNMNVNEVIGHLVKIYDKTLKIHANDDCNKCQSTNDIIPTALNITLRKLTKELLIPALKSLRDLLDHKAKQWQSIPILGRTHTMDAVLMSLGQVFSGYQHQIAKNISNFENNLPRFCEVPMGGTAVGNGINAHPDFGQRVVEILNNVLGEAYKITPNRFEQQSSRDDYVLFAGLVDTLATSLIKLANDIRWYGSGPAGGINELILPTTQAGSSCMPGKKNPVVCETLLQVCIYVQSHCDMIRRCSVIGGQFQLNTTSALIIYALIESLQVLPKAIDLFVRFLLKDLQPNLPVIKQHVQNAYVSLTLLAPKLGYDQTAKLIQEGQVSRKKLQDLLKEHCQQLDTSASE